MSITGERDGVPARRRPAKGGPVAIADLMTGMYATIGVMAALAHRDRTGRKGKYIDMALLDVAGRDCSRT